MDCVLIQGGKAHEIWRTTRKADLRGRYAQEIVDAIVETADGVAQPGDLWDGATFTSPPAVIADLDAEAQWATASRSMRAWMLFYLRDKFGRTPTVSERAAARAALITAYKDAG